MNEPCVAERERLLGHVRRQADYLDARHRAAVGLVRAADLVALWTRLGIEPTAPLLQELEDRINEWKEVRSWMPYPPTGAP